MRPKRYVLFDRFEDMYSQIVDDVNELSLNHGETQVLKPLLSPNDVTQKPPRIVVKLFS